MVQIQKLNPVDVVTDCYGCKVAETHQATALRGNADCISCDARALALEYGGKQRSQTEPALRLAWQDIATFNRGRPLFWAWIRRIDEARGSQTEAKEKA